MIEVPVITSHPIPNFSPGRGQYKPFLFVVHIMDGGLPGTDATFENRASKASSTYGLALAAPYLASGDYPYVDVHQYVKETDTPWTNGLPNGYIPNPSGSGYIYSPSHDCIHKRLPGGAINPNYPTAAGYIEGTDPNMYSVTAELAGFGVDCVYGTTSYKATRVNDAQYRTLGFLIGRWSTRYGVPITSDSVIGHGDLYAGKRGRCPGPGCDMERVRSEAQSAKIRMAGMTISQLYGPLL